MSGALSGAVKQPGRDAATWELGLEARRRVDSSWLEGAGLERGAGRLGQADGLMEWRAGWHGTWEVRRVAGEAAAAWEVRGEGGWAGGDAGTMLRWALL